MTVHVYLSAHLDDAVYSCGGLIHAQAQRGEQIIVLTAFAGGPPAGALSEFAQELHQRWGAGRSAVEARRQEDRAACAVLGARPSHLDLPEAIYRRGRDGAWLYLDEAAIFGPPAAGDEPTLAALASSLVEACPPGSGVSAPLGIGGHVDHRLLRLAAERLDRPLVYYRDQPYAAAGAWLPKGVQRPPGEEMVLPVTDEDLEAWRVASTCYRSQFSTFWKDEAELKEHLARIVTLLGGIPVVKSGGPLADSN
jgi:LmbE family N-acetylglucosaminyl deacetylase